MDTLSWIAVFSLTVFGPVLAEDDLNIQLNVSPAGEIRQGDTVTLTCSRNTMNAFDVIKILRKVEAVKYEILVNANLKDAYKTTGRYTFLKDESSIAVAGETSKIVLQITGITGADRGEYECEDLSTRKGAVETINVLVPPESVNIEYKNDNTDYVKDVPDSETVVFSSEMNAGLKCSVTVQGSLEMPTVTLKMGDQDVSSRFHVEPTEVNIVDAVGLYETGKTYVYEETLDQPNKMDNGKTFSCSAKMPNHDKVLAKSINVEVHYKPDLSCAVDMAKSKKGSEKMLTCTATMNPKYTQAVWSWKENDKKVTLTPDEGKTPDGNMHFMTSENGDQYTFTLHILKVGDNDFRRYKLSVNNGVGDSQEASVKLEEEETTTPKPTTTTTKPNQNGDGNSDSVVDDTGAEGNSAACLSTLLVSTLTFIVILLHRL